MVVVHVNQKDHHHRYQLLSEPVVEVVETKPVRPLHEILFLGWILELREVFNPWDPELPLTVFVPLFCSVLPGVLVGLKSFVHV